MCTSHKHWSHDTTDSPDGTYSVEFERARNFFPLSFLRLPLRFPGERQNMSTHFKYKHIQYRAEYLLTGQQRACMSWATTCLFVIYQGRRQHLIFNQTTNQWTNWEMCVLPCHELLLGLPFSQMSEMCLASGILSLHEWDRPLDLYTHTHTHGQKMISTTSFFQAATNH